MAYYESNADSLIDGFSMSPLPYPVLLILAVISIFFGVSWHKSRAEEVEEGASWALLIVLIVLLLIVVGLSSMAPDWLYWMTPWGGRRRTYYAPSEGSSPWGVAAVIVLLLVLLQYQSKFRDSWLL